ncbi:MAG: hypothetical protein IT198_04740 [Acidimicrobiia bacterium]|nr:hypothetical protein [Acidimicrobiia bacterium]
MVDEFVEEEIEYAGTVRIAYTGPVIPHWRYELVEGDRESITELVHRANSVIGLLPPGDPQFRRNRDRVQRDAERNGITIEWVGVNLPEDREERGDREHERARPARSPRT